MSVPPGFTAHHSEAIAANGDETGQLGPTKRGTREDTDITLALRPCQHGHLDVSKHVVSHSDVDVSAAVRVIVMVVAFQVARWSVR